MWSASIAAVRSNWGEHPATRLEAGLGRKGNSSNGEAVVTHPNCILIVFIATLCVAESNSAAKCPPSCAKGSCRHDIVNAVGAAAAKDCGCGSCAAKDRDPCDGKNYYYCVAK